jgi:hypothetical protein
VEESLREARLGKWLQCTAASSLNDTRNQNHGQRISYPAEEGRDGEDNDAGNQEALASKPKNQLLAGKITAFATR